MMTSSTLLRSSSRRQHCNLRVVGRGAPSAAWRTLIGSPSPTVRQAACERGPRIEKTIGDVHLRPRTRDIARGEGPPARGAGQSHSGAGVGSPGGVPWRRRGAPGTRRRPPGAAACAGCGASGAAGRRRRERWEEGRRTGERGERLCAKQKEGAASALRACQTWRGRSLRGRHSGTARPPTWVERWGRGGQSLNVASGWAEFTHSRGDSAAAGGLR